MNQLPTIIEVVTELKSKANTVNVAGMARFGINTINTLGISVVELRKIAKQISPNHSLALELWQTGVHEAKILAAYVDVPSQVTEAQLEAWVRDFDSWDICDQVCSNLFDRTPWAYAKAEGWPSRTEEFVRRAGFVLMAALSVHDKKQPDHRFLEFFPLIVNYSTDERNFVKKAVNWALRQIGKRSSVLLEPALKLASELAESDSISARWIGKDAYRELEKKRLT